MRKPLTHPSLAAPADVIYFVGWINPRPNHAFAAFIRFTSGSAAYVDLGLASAEKREAIAVALNRFLKQEDWRTLESAVSIPGGVSASAPISYEGLPVVLWPSADTLAVMKSPNGHRPGGGAVA